LPVVVTFTPPASGASATLAGSPATIEVIIGSGSNGHSSSFAAGTASVTATANTIAGTYSVTASASGVATPASFTLTNIASVTVPSGIFILDPTAGGALTLSGSAGINVPGNVIVDSSSTSALTISGAASVKAGAIEVVGGVK
jgi:hypothetical protein